MKKKFTTTRRDNKKKTHTHTHEKDSRDNDEIHARSLLRLPPIFLLRYDAVRRRVAVVYVYDDDVDVVDTPNPAKNLQE